MADFYGDEQFASSCQSHKHGLRVVLHLGQTVARVDLGDWLDSSDDLVVPLSVADDRRSVSASIPTDPRVGPHNIVCLYGALVGPGRDQTDYTTKRLLDGFTAGDGNVGPYAADSLISQLRYLYNLAASKKQETSYDAPGWSATCTPKAGSVYVVCRARGRIWTFPGDPLVQIRGSRILELPVKRGVLGGPPAALVVWRQAMRVRVDYRRCPRKVDRTRVGKSCRLRFVWKRGDLREAFIDAAHRRSVRTGSIRDR